MLSTKTATEWLKSSWLEGRYYHACIIFLALLTAVLLWFTHYQVFDVQSLQFLWLARHEPTDIFQHFLAPFAQNDATAMLWAACLSTAYLWLFCRLSLLVGIGRQTTFILFLLLNFNPEFNSVRLQIAPVQPVILLWLSGLYGFLREKNLYLACGVWLFTAWLSVLFEPFAAVWMLGFPIGLLFWTANGRWHWRDRGKILGIYYVTVALLLCLVPSWRNALSPLWQSITGQLALSRLEMSFFISGDNQFELSAGDRFLLSTTLVAINALKVMGLIIAFLAGIALWKGLKSIFERQIKYFFLYCLVFGWVIAAVSFMYYGYLPSDLVYTPITMLALWLSSGAAFYALQRFKNRRTSPEKLLILFWVMISYALASVIAFGPSSDYLREAGEWAASHQPTGQVFSNHSAVLYYTGASPLPDSKHQVDLEHPLTTFYDLRPEDLVLHVQSRKKPLPDNLDLFKVIKVFTNNRGDKVYALHLQEE